VRKPENVATNNKKKHQFKYSHPANSTSQQRLSPGLVRLPEDVAPKKNYTSIQPVFISDTLTTQ
jgi:hypothetical protein